MKRYTDPSFFKVEWASSELMKAQRAQRDKKARREKVCQSCMISFFGSDLEKSVNCGLARSSAAVTIYDIFQPECQVQVGFLFRNCAHYFNGLHLGTPF